MFTQGPQRLRRDTKFSILWIAIFFCQLGIKVVCFWLRLILRKRASGCFHKLFAWAHIMVRWIIKCVCSKYQKQWGDVLCNSVSDALYIKSVLVMTCARHFFFLDGLFTRHTSQSQQAIMHHSQWLAEISQQARPEMLSFSNNPSLYSRFVLYGNYFSSILKTKIVPVFSSLKLSPKFFYPILSFFFPS